MRLSKFATALTAAALAATSLTACGGSDSDGSSSNAASGPAEGDTIRIGTTDASKSAWTVFEEEAEKQGIDLDVISYSDYTTPNNALAEGQDDVNLFQHLKFLAEFNNGTGNHLVPIGATEIVPLALFWKGHDSLDGIEGQSVVIPSDSSNQGRAINVLVQAGLITLKEDGLITPTPVDIDESASKVTVTPVEATQTANAYNEGRPAIINNTFLERAGIDPKTSVYADDPSSPEAEPYINAFVTTEDNADNEQLKKLVEIWHSDPVQEAVDNDSRGTSVEVERGGEELTEILDRIQKQSPGAS